MALAVSYLAILPGATVGVLVYLWSERAIAARLVVVGGLVTSTLYSLFILPALYLRLVAREPRAGAATPQQEGTS